MSHAVVKPDSEAQLGDWTPDIGSSGAARLAWTAEMTGSQLSEMDFQQFLGLFVIGVLSHDRKERIARERARERERKKYGRARPLRQSENKTVFKDVPLGCLKTVAGLDEYKFENRRKRRETRE